MRRRHEVDINVRTYTILLAGFGESGDKEAMLRVWSEMKGNPHARPNKISYGCLLDCLGRMGAVQDMLDVYREAKQQCGVTEVMYNHLLTHLGKTGKIEQAEEVFDEMKRDIGVRPNVMLYNVMLDLYAKAVLADVRRLHSSDSCSLSRFLCSHSLGRKPTNALESRVAVQRDARQASDADQSDVHLSDRGRIESWTLESDRVDHTPDGIGGRAARYKRHLYSLRHLIERRDTDITVLSRRSRA
jgi:pentatricopeptide repeat protein